MSKDDGPSPPGGSAQHVKPIPFGPERATIASKAGDLDAFFESHLAFRRKVWKLSGNRYVEQILERVVIPLYALYVIRQSYNLEGIRQTTIDCTEHQDRILAAYEQNSFEEAREIARYFLKRMKEYLGTRLPPASMV